MDPSQVQAPTVQVLDRDLIERTLARARTSERRRVNHNFHSGPRDNPHRFLNAMLRGSYITPHRHLVPPKSETFLVLHGTVVVFVFDDSGGLTARHVLGEHRVLAVDIAPGVWHSVAALSDEAVCLEVKPGPWDPALDKEFAPWAPREGHPDAATFLRRLMATASGQNVVRTW